MKEARTHYSGGLGTARKPVHAQEPSCAIKWAPRVIADLAIQKQEERSLIWLKQ